MKDQILYLLKTKQDFCSGEEISRLLKVSRAGIWKHICELKSSGYDIESVLHKGYRLKKRADKLFEWEIEQGLKTKMLGKQVIFKESLPSTMDEALKLARQGFPEGTVVCAETQTKGRGRMNRAWSSQKSKGIYASVILRPRVSPAESSLLTLIAGIAVCEAVREASGLDAKIKWPNDIFIGDKKIAGILTEMNAEMDSIHFVVIGIGVNVSSTRFPKHVNATSLYLEGKKNIGKVPLFQKILQHLEFWYGIFLDGQQSRIRGAWKDLSMTLGREICLKDMFQETRGRAVDIDVHGGLVIDTPQGRRVKRMSGDVVFAD